MRTHMYICIYKIHILSRNAEPNEENEVLKSQIEESKKALDEVKAQEAKRFV